MMQGITNHRQRLRSVERTNSTANTPFSVSASTASAPASASATTTMATGAVASSRYYNREYENRVRSNMNMNRSPTASPNASPLRKRPSHNTNGNGNGNENIHMNDSGNAGNVGGGGNGRTPSPYRNDYSRSQHHHQQQEREQEQKQQQQHQQQHQRQQHELEHRTSRSEINTSYTRKNAHYRMTDVHIPPKAQSVINSGITNSGVGGGGGTSVGGLNVKDFANRLNNQVERKSSFRPAWLKNVNANANANANASSSANTRENGTVIGNSNSNGNSISNENGNGNGSSIGNGNGNNSNNHQTASSHEEDNIKGQSHSHRGQMQRQRQGKGQGQNKGQEMQNKQHQTQVVPVPVPVPVPISAPAQEYSYSTPTSKSRRKVPLPSTPKQIEASPLTSASTSASLPSSPSSTNENENDNNGVLQKAHFWRTQASQKTSPIRSRSVRRTERSPSRLEKDSSNVGGDSSRTQTDENIHTHTHTQLNTHTRTNPITGTRTRNASISPRRKRLNEFKAEERHINTNTGASARTSMNKQAAVGANRSVTRQISISPQRRRFGTNRNRQTLAKQQEEEPIKLQEREDQSHRQNENADSNIDAEPKSPSRKHLSPRRQRLMKDTFDTQHVRRSLSPSRRRISVSPNGDKVKVLSTSKTKSKLNNPNLQSIIAQFSSSANGCLKDGGLDSKNFSIKGQTQTQNLSQIMQTRTHSRVKVKECKDGVEKGKKLDEAVTPLKESPETKPSHNTIDSSSANIKLNIGSQQHGSRSHFWKNQLKNRGYSNEDNESRQNVRDYQSGGGNASLIEKQSDSDSHSNSAESNSTSKDPSPETMDSSSKRHFHGKGGVNKKAQFWISQQTKRNQDSTIIRETKQSARQRDVSEQKPKLTNALISPDAELESPPRLHSDGGLASNVLSLNESLDNSTLQKSRNGTAAYPGTSTHDDNAQYKQYMSKNKPTKPKVESSFLSNEDSIEMDIKQREEFRRHIGVRNKPAEMRITKTWPPQSDSKTEMSAKIECASSPAKSSTSSSEASNSTEMKQSDKKELQIVNSSRGEWRNSLKRTVNSNPKKELGVDSIKRNSIRVSDVLPGKSMTSVRKKEFEKTDEEESALIGQQTGVGQIEGLDERQKLIQTSYSRMNKLKQYNRIVKSQVVITPTSSSRSPCTPKKVENSSMLVTPSRSTATTVTTMDESQNELTPWTTPQRRSITYEMRSPIKEEIQNVNNDNSTVITDTSSFLPVSEVKKRLWDDGEHLKQWSKDDVGRQAQAKEDINQASSFKSRYYRAAEVAQKNCAENKSPIVQPPANHKKGPCNLKERTAKEIAASTHSAQANCQQEDYVMPRTTFSRTSTENDKSVESLLEKLSSVQRDDPNTALEVIDSIIKNERNILGQKKSEKETSRHFEEPRESIVAASESFKYNEEVVSEASESSDYVDSDSDDSTVSSITNPTYMSGFGDSFSNSRKQHFSRMLAKDGRLSPPCYTKRQSSFLARPQQNPQRRSPALPPRQPQRKSMSEKLSPGSVPINTNDNKRTRSLTQENNATEGSPMRSKDHIRAQTASPAKSFQSGGSSSNNQGILNKFKDWDDKSQEIEPKTKYPEKVSRSPQSPGERLKRLADAAQIISHDSDYGPNAKPSEHNFNERKSRRFLYPKQLESAGEAEICGDSWEPSSSTDFFGTNVFQNSNYQSATQEQRTESFQVFKQCGRGNNTLASKQLHRKFSHLEKAYQH